MMERRGQGGREVWCSSLNKDAKKQVICLLSSTSLKHRISDKEKKLKATCETLPYFRSRRKKSERMKILKLVLGVGLEIYRFSAGGSAKRKNLDFTERIFEAALSTIKMLYSAELVLTTLQSPLTD
jgi:hypothetical protein